MLIRNYGLFWKREDVHWGRQKNSGQLLGIPNSSKKSDPTDFRKQVGFYALYDDSFSLLYFGQAGRGKEQTLFGRLRTHRTDHLSSRWTKFSWFGIIKVNMDGKLSDKPDNLQGKNSIFLDQTEAIVISVSEPPNNIQGGRFGSAKQYIQYRDVEKLGPSREDMLSAVYENMKN